MEEHNKHEEYSKQDESNGQDELRISKLTLWKGISAVLGILLVIAIVTGGFGSKVGSFNQGQAAPAAQPSAPAAQNAPSPTVVATDIKTLIDDDAIEGNAKAKVTIVEWSDYECPFCVKFYNGAYQDIKKNYIDSGKVKFIYRDYPLQFHQNAQKAAEAAECAGEQGKYYDMHNKLFEKGVAGGAASFKQYAAEIGLDAGKFNDCLDSGKMASETAKDMKDGQTAGISGTPGFIINGNKIVGAQPFENFKQVIDAELAK